LSSREAHHGPGALAEQLVNRPVVALTDLPEMVLEQRMAGRAEQDRRLVRHHHTGPVGQRVFELAEQRLGRHVRPTWLSGSRKPAEEQLDERPQDVRRLAATAAGVTDLHPVRREQPRTVAASSGANSE
jgi:hypothetical protein